MEAKKRGLRVQPDDFNKNVDKENPPQFMFLRGLPSGEHIQQKSLCDVYLDVSKIILGCLEI
jgi:hypothetical protein